jgi:O-methyltransferase involved in polyketide biosynthesis
VGDVRTFPLPGAGLILILDVLQYLDASEQTSLLRRCAAALQPGGRLIFRLPDTARGLYSWTTRSLDRIIFRAGGARIRPAYQTVESYERLLAEAGMTVAVRRSRNRLPLAHVVIAATKPR